MIVFDVIRMTTQLIGARLSKSTTMSFINSIMHPLKLMFDSFYLFYELKRYDLSINSSVIYLERVLNDRFDNDNREIYISDSQAQLNEVVLFNEAEQNELTVLFNESEGEDNTVLYNQSELITSPNFIVNIPNALVFNENQLLQLMNIYKTSGKNYIINYF